MSAEQNGTEPFYYFGGRRQTFAETTDAVKQVWQALHRTCPPRATRPRTTAIPRPDSRSTTCRSCNGSSAGCPAATPRPWANCWTWPTTSSTAPKSADQSALNLLYLLGYSGPGQFRIFGPSNEKYHVRGGNDQIVEPAGAAVDGQIETDAALSAIARTLRRPLYA